MEPATFVTEPRQYDVAERYLHLAAEAATDIDHHLTLEAIRNDLDDLEALASVAAELL